MCNDDLHLFATVISRSHGNVTRKVSQKQFQVFVEHLEDIEARA
jgi:hypothetical protein